MLVGLRVLFLGIAGIMGVSIARFSGDIGSYTGKLNDQLANIQSLTKNLGVSKGIAQSTQSQRPHRGHRRILSGVADFLSDLFLILIIVLFLLAEGPAMMNRLHASTATDHPQVERLTVFGRSVIRQLGLRAIVNLATATGVVRLTFRVEGRLSANVGRPGLLP